MRSWCGVGAVSAALALALAACFDFSGYSQRAAAAEDSGATLDSSGEAETGIQDSSLEAEAEATCDIPDNSACNLIKQCGCSGQQACDVIFVDGRTACVPTKNLTRGSKCEEVGDCAPGLSCVGSACKPFCEKPTDCQQGADCMEVSFSLGDGGITIPYMSVCTDECDPTKPQPQCAADLGCMPTEDPGVVPGHSACTAAGAATADCSASDLCAPGLVCLTDGKCHKWCHANGTDCETSQTCRELLGGSGQGFLYVGDTAYGVCSD